MVRDLEAVVSVLPQPKVNLFGTGFTFVSLLIFTVIAVQHGEWPFAGGAVVGFFGIVLSVFARLKARAVPLKM